MQDAFKKLTLAIRSAVMKFRDRELHDYIASTAHEEMVEHYVSCHSCFEKLVTVRATRAATQPPAEGVH